MSRSNAPFRPTIRRYGLPQRHHVMTAILRLLVVVLALTGLASAADPSDESPLFESGVAPPSQEADLSDANEVTLADGPSAVEKATAKVGEAPLDNSADELGDLRKRIEQLEKERAAEKAKAASGTKTGASGDKPKEEKKDDKKDASAASKAADEWLDLSTEKWDVKLGGHVQMDFVTWANADPAIQGDQNYFEFRRLRLAADGKGYGVYDFRLQMTLEPESIAEQTSATPEVKDAYFSINEIPLLGRWRIGNFFGHSRWNR